MTILSGSPPEHPVGCLREVLRATNPEKTQGGSSAETTTGYPFARTVRERKPLVPFKQPLWRQLLSNFAFGMEPWRQRRCAGRVSNKGS
jgi:hypothetical protein